MSFNYPTITFSKVFNSVIRAKGLDPATAGLSAAQEETIADMINEWIRRAWEFAWWGFLTVCEARTVTASATLGNYVALTQSGLSAIGHVKSVSQANPMTSTTPNSLTYRITSAGIVLTPTITSTSVYVVYRPRVPAWTRVAWAAGTTYAAGDLCYASGIGETVLALKTSTGQLPTGDSEYWEVLRIPSAFAAYVRQMALAHWLWEDEQKDKAIMQEQRAEDELIRARSINRAQQGQYDVANVVV